MNTTVPAPLHSPRGSEVFCRVTSKMQFRNCVLSHLGSPFALSECILKPMLSFGMLRCKPRVFTPFQRQGFSIGYLMPLILLSLQWTQKMTVEGWFKACLWVSLQSSIWLVSRNSQRYSESSVMSIVRNGETYLPWQQGETCDAAECGTFAAELCR